MIVHYLKTETKKLVSGSISSYLVYLIPILSLITFIFGILLYIDQTLAAAGKLLHDTNYKFDMAYTSCLKRAIRTLWHSLEQVILIPTHCK